MHSRIAPAPLPWCNGVLTRPRGPGNWCDAVSGILFHVKHGMRYPTVPTEW